MFLMSHPINTLNGGGIAGSGCLGSGIGVMDESNTINPASLNTAPVLPNPFPNATAQPSPRRLKRSRSPETYVASAGDLGDEDESKPRKRGRPKAKSSASPPQITHPGTQVLPPPVQTPQSQTKSLPQTSPLQTSTPPKATPTKQPVLKALPTVRDHTTDQLNPEGDEYLPREFDEEGEKKVTPSGHILGGREYRCKTFYVPNRGNKLFMLATECARVLGYRDSYLLFNKNRSLYKIIASQAEKDDLIQQEILLYSYRSRQIAIVTARSMFRQFGGRLIVNGRRVRDDYWESKARKQGFTEEDAAGEKRPGAAKQREAAAAEASNAQAQNAMPHSEIIYANRPGTLDMQSGVGRMNQATLPMIGLAPTDNMQPRDYGHIPRPRQEISGVAYQDRSLPSSAPEILNQAAQTADFNKILRQQRSGREQYLDDHWKRQHEPQVILTQRQSSGEVEGMQLMQHQQQSQSQHPQQHSQLPPQQHPGLQSPHSSSSAPGMASIQHSMMPHQQQGVGQLPVMTPHSYVPQQAQAQAQGSRKGIAQSPVRSSSMHHQQMRPEQQAFDRSPSMGLVSGAPHGAPMPPAVAYGYPPNQMWPPTPNHHHSQQSPHQQQHHQQHQSQPHPSPLSQSQTTFQQHSQYGRQQSPMQQQSPLPAHHQSPMHGSHNGGTAVSSHMRAQPSGQQMNHNPNAAAAAAAMGYPNMSAMPGMPGLSSPAAVGGYSVGGGAAVTPLGRNPYQQATPGQNHNVAAGMGQQHLQQQQHPGQHQQQQLPGTTGLGQQQAAHQQHQPQHQQQQGWPTGPGQAGHGGPAGHGGWMGY